MGSPGENQNNHNIRIELNIYRLNKKVYDLLNRPKIKFEKSITIDRGINYYGVCKLYFWNEL